MLRVVLDSNVIVSAALSAKGQPATVLDALREERFDLVISEAILSELSRVFFYPRIARRLGWKEEDVLDVLSALQRIATVGPGDLTLSVVAGDEAGNRYLECAIEGSADYLVTGDRHLLDLGYYEHVRIVSARGFLAVLSELERSG